MMLPSLATINADASTGSALKVALITVPGSIVKVTFAFTTTLPFITTSPDHVVSVVIKVT